MTWGDGGGIGKSTNSVLVETKTISSIMINYIYLSACITSEANYFIEQNKRQVPMALGNTIMKVRIEKVILNFLITKA